MKKNEKRPFDAFDTNEPAALIENDVAYDTHGTLADGSFFESFEGDEHPDWIGTDSAILSYADGKMRLESKTFDFKNEAFVYKNITVSEDFEFEIKAKMGYYGGDNGFYLNFNGARVVVYLFESKLRVNMDRNAKGFPKGELFYTEIGYDWHTYRVEVHSRIAKLYLDGVLLTSFVTEPAGSSGRIGFHAFPINQFNSTWMEVDYVSYRPLASESLRITSPSIGEKLVTNGAAVNVRFDCAEELAEKEISFYLNGIYAGKSRADVGMLALNGLGAGVYSVSAACEAHRSNEIVFEVLDHAEDTLDCRMLSGPEALQSAYILKYVCNATGALTASDGLYRLALSYADGGVTYLTDEGEKTVGGAFGDAIAVVDGGVAILYANGRQIVSFRMPYAPEESGLSFTGGIEAVEACPHSATLYRRVLDGAFEINESASFLPLNYALEFEYTGGEPLDAILKDGAYQLNFSVSESRELSVLIAPQLNAYTKVLCKMDEGRSHYRIAVYDGIAQIFVNNVWRASWKMPQTVSKPNIFLRGAGVGSLQIREMNDVYYFDGTPSDPDWSSYFGSNSDFSENKSECLKVFPKNSIATAKIAITPEASGLFCLVSRYFGGTPEFTDSGIFAGYDFDEDCFKVGFTGKTLARVESKLSLKGKTEATLSLTVRDNRAVLLCNGEEIVEIVDPHLDGRLEDWELNGCGYVGFLKQYRGVELLRFSYEGDSKPLCGSATTLIPNAHTVGICEMDEKVYIMGEWGARWASENGGDTFTQIEGDNEHSSFNQIVLQSGKVLSLVRKNDGGFTYFAYLSSDNTKTWEGPYDVMNDRNAYRITMNGKLMQASNGRVFFVSGETEDENIGMLWIYYSDDEGRTWTKSKTVFTHGGTGENLQEGAIVEMDGGVLRMYARNDGGFLVYSDSRDNGETWDLCMQTSNFISVVSAFNVTRDPDNGDIYMAWEYNNVNDCAIIQFPRTRVGVARSCDGGLTWEYIGETDDRNHVHFRCFVHWNIGIWVTKDSIFATVGKSIWDKWYNCTVRIRKASLQPLARFTGVRCPFRDPKLNTEGKKLSASSLLAISPRLSLVSAAGTVFEIKETNGLCTYLTAEMIAAYLNGTLTLCGKTATVRVGNAEYAFTADQKLALLDGEEKALTCAPVFEDGTVKVCVGDLRDLLGLTARQNERGEILLTKDPAPTDLAQLLW